MIVGSRFDWDACGCEGGNGGGSEGAYKRSIMAEMELTSRTIFRAAFAPTENDALLVVVASSDGSIASYPVSKIIGNPLPDPSYIFPAHDGPVFDLLFYNQFGASRSDAILFSCGDDGHVCGWKASDMLHGDDSSTQDNHLKRVLDLVNTRQEGPWGSCSPIPENNAIAASEQEGSIFSAAGDGCAYCWDVESGKLKMIFRGHSDYLHCVSVRNSTRQIITGSEDGTVRLWDARSGKCIRVIEQKGNEEFRDVSWISSIAVDSTDNWLACGTSSGLSVWSLLSYERIFHVDTRAAVQDVIFDRNQILAVGSEPLISRFSINGTLLSQIKCAPKSAFSVSLHPCGVVAVSGYGGLVDVISDLGSHLCTFNCRGLDVGV